MDYKIKGTPIPIGLIGGLNYGVLNEGDIPASTSHFSSSHDVFVSFGSVQREGNTLILVEREGYNSNLYYTFYEKDLMKKIAIAQLKSGKYVFYLANKEQHTLLAKAGVNLVSWKGEYQYSSDGMYAGATTKLTDSMHSCWEPGGYIFIKFEDIDLDREIVGYIAPQDLYGGSLVKGTIYVKDGRDNFYHPENKDRNAQMVPKEIVETWEPVYKEVGVTINLGTPERKFLVEKDKITVTSSVGSEYPFTWDDVESLERIFAVEKKIGQFKLKIPSVQIGCAEGTALTSEDILSLKQTKQNL